MTPQQSALIDAVQAHIDAKAREFTFNDAADLYSRAAFDQSQYFPLAYAFAGWVDGCWLVSDAQVLFNGGALPTEAELLVMMPAFDAGVVWPLS